MCGCGHLHHETVGKGVMHVENGASTTETENLVPLICLGDIYGSLSWELNGNPSSLFPRSSWKK